MVIDELVLYKDMTGTLIDSYNNEMIDEINYEGQKFHFAKQKDLTGTSEVVADNAVDEPIVALQVSGNTTQKTYAGYNLLNKEDFNQEGLRNETDVSLMVSGVLSNEVVNSIFKPNTTYTMSFEVEGLTEVPNGVTITNATGFILYSPTLSAFWFDIATVIKKGEIKQFSKTFTTSETFYEGNYTMRGYSGRFVLDGVGTIVECIFRNVQIVEGSTQKPYEPYVGGIPSPNSDYPQKIENANSEGMSVTLHGENLFQFGKDSYTQGKIYRNAGITYTVQDDGGIHCNGTLTGSYSYFIFVYAKEYGQGIYTLSASGKNIPQSVGIQMRKYTASGAVVQVGNAKVGKPLAHTLLDGETFHYFAIMIATTEKVDFVIYPMLNYGKIVKPYEPYFREEIAIPASVEVEGKSVPLLMSVYDKLTVDRLANKVIYTEGSWARAITGNEVWYKTNTTNGSWFHISTASYNVTPRPRQGYCTHFKVGTYIGDTPNNSFVPDNSEKIVFVRYDDVTTLADFKAWLKERYAEGNPVTFLLKRNNITHDITNTALGQSLLALATHKGTNHLEIEGNLTPSKIDLSYWRQIIPNE